MPLSVPTILHYVDWLAAYAKLLNASPVPELPDITIYLDALNARVVGQTLTRIRITSPFLLRTAVPPISECEGRKVWHDRPAKLAGKQNLAAFDFSNGTLTLTEAGTKKRASLHLVKGEDALRAIDRGGLEDRK